MGESFAHMEEDVTALTLWHRVQKCIESLPTALCGVLGFSVSEIGQLIVTDSEMRNNFEIMTKALENRSECFILYGMRSCSLIAHDFVFLFMYLNLYDFYLPLPVRREVSKDISRLSYKTALDLLIISSK